MAVKLPFELTMRNVLVCSLALNVMIFAVLGGFVYARLQSDWFYGSAEDFSPESAHMVARVMRKTRDDLEKEMVRLQKARSEILEVLQEDEFNNVNFEHHADDLKKTHARILNSKIEATRSLARGLPDEERIRLAGRLAEALGEPRRLTLPWYKNTQAPKPTPKPE
jgi:uncharacterized membrane protein